MSTGAYQSQQSTHGYHQPPAYTQPGQAPYPQGQPVHAPYPAGQAVYSQGQNVVVVTQPGQRAHGTCPYCGIGFARTNYTMIGIIIAILFFPLGIICCMMMTERLCSNCGAKF